jgi:hypothetical protein
MDTAKPFGAASNLISHISFYHLFILRLLLHWALIILTLILIKFDSNYQFDYRPNELYFLKSCLLSRANLLIFSLIHITPLLILLHLL